MKIGPYQLPNNLILAPMAGVTDRPFRILCKRLGAGLVVSEMVSSNPQLLNTTKTALRLNHDGEAEPIAVQIAGGDAEMMAEAAKFNVEHGAQIIDINMGCPAKKVCNKAAGSALLKDEKLVAEILDAVVNAVDVPVTLKIRTGWDRDNKNGVRIARLAQEAGMQALAVHGRTRADRYNGDAEYETIAAIKASVSIPIIANGDVNDPKKAVQVLKETGADALMIGRGAQGRPWIFRELECYLNNKSYTPPSLEEIKTLLLEHVKSLYDFYGEFMGVRIARKHVGWYCKAHEDAKVFQKKFNVLQTPEEQLELIVGMFAEVGNF